MKRIYIAPAVTQQKIELMPLLGASDPLTQSSEEATTSGTGDDKEYQNSLSRQNIWEDEEDF